MKRLLLSISLLILLSQNVFSQEPSKVFSKAMDAYHSGLYAETYRLFQGFFNHYEMKDELYATAKYYSADALLNLGDKDAAAADFEFLVNNFQSSSYRDGALYKLGIIYFDTQQYSKARARFETMLYEYPNSEHTGNALYWIGESYSAQNRLKDAINYLEEAVAKRKNNKYEDYSLYTLAAVYEKTGDYANAVKYYDQLLSYHKDSPLAVSAQIRIGICYFKLKDYHSSILELNNPLIHITEYSNMMMLKRLISKFLKAFLLQAFREMQSMVWRGPTFNRQIIIMLIRNFTLFPMETIVLL